MNKQTTRRLRFAGAWLALAVFSGAASSAAQLAPVKGEPAGLQKIPAHTAGRITAAGAYQWPGLYFETRFKGTGVYFTTGPGDVILHVLVDGEMVGTLVKPAAGMYLIDGLTNKPHDVHIDAVTESQAGPNIFGGFSLPPSAKALPMMARKRQIEFIGDSHTVGYGNTSRTRDCTEDDVWKTTDNSQAFGAKIARHYDADYQINAVSGRGIVRNYDGFIGDALPVSYPFVLLDRATRYDNPAWKPRIIVIALGANDFSTQLHAGEKWATREELRADYEANYVKFVQSLRARNPQAFFVLWATDMAEQEVQKEVGKVIDQLKSKGERRIGFVPISGLEMTGCNWHPSLADHDVNAAALIRYIDSEKSAWDGR
jgi:lysophospholipase L1-like esterase